MKQTTETKPKYYDARLWYEAKRLQEETQRIKSNTRNRNRGGAYGRL